MKRPEAISGRDFGEKLPYIGEYYQPDDRVYKKKVADAYFDFLENKLEEIEGKLKDIHETMPLYSGKVT